MNNEQKKEVLAEAISNLKCVPLPTEAWGYQRRRDFTLGVVACVNILERMAGLEVSSMPERFATATEGVPCP